MSRSFLRRLSLGIAAGTGALLGYGGLQLMFLESALRSRSLRPDVLICRYGLLEVSIVVAVIAACLALFLAALFWRSYERLPVAAPAGDPRS